MVVSRIERDSQNMYRSPQPVWSTENFASVLGDNEQIDILQYRDYRFNLIADLLVR